MRSMKKLVRVLAATALASATVLVGAPAFAQEDPVADNANDAGLGIIVVTAQKREESLQKVPATIAALGSDELQLRQIQDVSGLQAEVPSLVVGSYYGTSLITLRGISTGLTSGAEDPSVATHINGVYQPRSRSVDSAMADLERVEVLSGPQGTLYGRNATGGVINYILKRPTNQFEGEVTARVGNYDRYGAQARVSGPISDDVRVLVSGIFENQDRGYAKNLLPNAPRDRLDSGKFAGGRFAIDVGDSSGVNLQLDAIYLDTRTVPVAEAFSTPDDPNLLPFLGPVSVVPRQTYSNIGAFTHSKIFQGIATLSIPISDNVNFKSITGYQTFRDKMYIDLDSSGVTSVEILQPLRSNTLTQEFNLNTETFDGRLKSVFGLFYFNDDFSSKAVVDFVLPGFGGVQTAFTDISSKSYAAFMDHTFSVTERFRLQFGLRYNRDEKDAVQSIDFGGFPICPTITGSRRDKAWTPRVGAQFDVTDDAMLYGQWSKGFKSGGFTANSCGDDFEPESIEGPEVGIKTTLFDNRVRFNLSGYFYKYANLQVQKTVDVGVFFVVNAAEAEIYGAEFSLDALIADGLKFDVAGMLQSAKYTSFSNCNETAFPGACGAFDPRPVGSRETDVSGNWLNRAAPYSLNLGLQYTADLGNGGEVVLRGESYFSGRIYYSEFNIAQSTQNAYNLQNLYLTYNAPDDRFTIRGYVKNIGDKDYKRSYFFNSAVRLGNGNYGPPRTFGIDATVRF